MIKVKFFFVFIIILLGLSGFIPHTYSLCAAGELYVGTAKVNITPKVPIPMSGYSGRKENFKGIHDDLHARAIAFDDGETRALLISSEIIAISFSFWENTSKRIEDETGIPQKNILLCATHTHGGPSPEPSYMDKVADKLINAAKEAVANLKQARIGAGKGICKMNINRRARAARGGIVLGKNPYKPIDWEVGVVRIDNAQGIPLAVLTNWGCHCTVMGSRNYMITGDWAGAASRFIEKECGNNCIAPVLIGANGDVNPLYQGVNSFKTGIGEVEITGIVLGEEVVKVAQEIKTYPYGSVQVIQRVVLLPGKEETPEKQFREYGVNAFEPSSDNQLNLTVLKVGPIILAGVSAQVFNEFGTQFKELSPYKFSFIIDHCNGTTGYIPTDDEYREGGYEVLRSRTMPGNEKVIIKNLLDIIYEF